MTELYNREFALSQRAAYKKWLLISVGVCLSALVISVALCFFVTTRNARTLFVVVSALSIITGWTYLLWLRPLWHARRAQYQHCDNILSKTEIDYAEGRLHVSGDSTQVPGSIRVRLVTLKENEKNALYHVNADFSLPENGTPVRLGIVSGYVVGYEVTGDE